MKFCPVPPMRNEDARHVLRDGTVLKLYKMRKLHDPALRELHDSGL